jgi:hypothetical protein
MPPVEISLRFPSPPLTGKHPPHEVLTRASMPATGRRPDMLTLPALEPRRASPATESRRPRAGRHPASPWTVGASCAADREAPPSSAAAGRRSGAVRSSLRRKIGGWEIWMASWCTPSRGAAATFHGSCCRRPPGPHPGAATVGTHASAAPSPPPGGLLTPRAYSRPRLTLASCSPASRRPGRRGLRPRAVRLYRDGR